MAPRRLSDLPEGEVLGHLFPLFAGTKGAAPGLLGKAGCGRETPAHFRNLSGVSCAVTSAEVAGVRPMTMSARNCDAPGADWKP